MQSIPIADLSAGYDAMARVIDEAIKDFYTQIEVYLKKCVEALGLEPSTETAKRITRVIDEVNINQYGYYLDYQKPSELLLMTVHFSFDGEIGKDYQPKMVIKGIVQEFFIKAHLTV